MDSTDPTQTPAADPDGQPPPAPPLGRSLLVYSLARVALTVVIAAALLPFMPLLVAALLAVVVQLPLAWLLFGTLRRRANEAIAARSSRRREERERLQAALTGNDG